MGIKIILLFPRTPVEDAAYCYRRSVVCVSVCLLDITVSCAKTAEPIEMPFVLWARVGQKNNPVLGPDSLKERDSFGGPPYDAFVKILQPLVSSLLLPCDAHSS